LTFYAPIPVDLYFIQWEGCHFFWSWNE